jgi:GNAT superfamily N-acetyltransferase
MEQLPIDISPGCILRAGSQGDRWQLQKLVLRFIKEEVLGFDLRIFAFYLLSLSGYTILLKIQLFLLFRIESVFFASVMLITIIYNIILIFATFLESGRYLIYIFTEPLSNWRNYLVVERDRQIIACVALGRSRTHSTIYHLFVQSPWRHQGLGSLLIYHAIDRAYFPLYIICKPKMISFYTNLGFVAVTWQELPKQIQPKFKIFKPSIKLWGYPLILMQYQGIPLPQN